VLESTLLVPDFQVAESVPASLYERHSGPRCPRATDQVPTHSPRAKKPAPHHAEANPHGKRLFILSLTALGVVYGDIGTSPLYAIKEAFKPRYGLAPNVANVYGPAVADRVGARPDREREVRRVHPSRG
jgi:hypothetical protein